jgi:hypothetical protein
MSASSPWDSWGDQIIEMIWEEKRAGLQWRNPKEIAHLKDLGVNWRIMLK